MNALSTPCRAPLPRRWAAALLSTVAVSLILAAPAAHASARVALVSLDDEAGLDPLALDDIVAAIRGVAADEAVDLFVVALDKAGLDHARCDVACVDGLAAPLGAELVLTGAVRVVDDGLTLELALRELGRDDVLQRASRFAVDTEGLVASTDALARDVLTAIGAAGVAAAPPTVVTRPRPARVVTAGPRVGERSPTLALVLELLFPGLGLGYADAWGAAALQYAGIFTGFLLVVSSVDGSGEVDPGFGLGVALILLSRVYGVAYAPFAAENYNERRFGPPDGSRYSLARELAAPVGRFSVPSFTRIGLPAVTF